MQGVLHRHNTATGKTRGMLHCHNTATGKTGEILAFHNAKTGVAALFKGKTITLWAGIVMEVKNTPRGSFF